VTEATGFKSVREELKPVLGGYLLSLTGVCTILLPISISRYIDTGWLLIYTLQVVLYCAMLVFTFVPILARFRLIFVITFFMLLPLAGILQFGFSAGGEVGFIVAIVIATIGFGYLGLIISSLATVVMLLTPHMAVMLEPIISTGIKPYILPHTDWGLALVSLLFFGGSASFLVQRMVIVLHVRSLQLATTLDELKSTQKQVIQTSKLATLGEMATSVAHELNQPLNVIRMAAGNSRRKIANGTADPGYLNDKLERIEEQTARAAIIIDHMRMFGRNATEHPVLIDPRHVMTNALDLIGEQLRLAEIEIVKDFAKDCTSVLGHTIQMEQVILNLLSNAKDAMAEKGGEAKILLRVFEDDEGVHIISEDTGGGIPDDVLPHIFEPFYTTKEMGKGTGLGLSVSYGIVSDMGGSIVAENTGNGARFTITLPIAGQQISGSE
jgi:signal transduction histidine kinase